MSAFSKAAPSAARAFGVPRVALKRRQRPTPNAQRPTPKERGEDRSNVREPISAHWALGVETPNVGCPWFRFQVLRRREADHFHFDYFARANPRGPAVRQTHQHPISLRADGDRVAVDHLDRITIPPANPKRNERPGVFQFSQPLNFHALEPSTPACAAQVRQLVQCVIRPISLGSATLCLSLVLAGCAGQQSSTMSRPTEKEAVASAQRFVRAYCSPHEADFYGVKLPPTVRFDQKARRWYVGFSSSAVHGDILVEMDETAKRAALSSYSLYGIRVPDADQLLTLSELRAAGGAESARQRRARAALNP